MTGVNECEVQECRQEWLTVRGAAKYLGVSAGFIRLLLSDEGLSYSKLRHTVFIRKDDIDALIERNRVV